MEFRNKMIETFEQAIASYNDLLQNKLIILKGTVEERMEAIKIKLQ